ncbi:MAG TPA: hypothetical protein VK157_07235, partial [Phycisphaerales bacterium]|nr:hypothetical protein [Phycisphaerales bacterium]
GLALAGQRFAPDVIAVQEMNNASALANLVTTLNTASGSPGDWASAPYIDSPAYGDAENNLVYRTSRFQLIATTTIALGSTATNNQPRNTYRYDLRPVGYSAPQSVVAIYSIHMKAGSASSDNARRLVESERIRSNAEGVNTNGPGTALPAGYNFIVAGDMNMQSSTQTSYVELVGSQANNAGQFFDPINTPGSWNNSAAFRFIHTQDPAAAGGGGMDDRHDQILISSSLRDVAGWHYIGSNSLSFSTSTWNDPNHTYRCWGNDGSTYNLALATTGNTMVGPAIAQALINCATTAGGHLPVYADFRVPAKASVSSTTLNFGTVTQGSAAPQQVLTVTNTGDVALFGANGIDTLNYNLPAASGFSVPVANFIEPPGGSGVSHVISMPTATVGTKNATLVIVTDSPEQPTLVVNLTGVVVPPNQPPNANAGNDITVTDSDNSGAEVVMLNGTASTDDGTIVLYEWLNGPTLLGTGSTLSTSLPVGATTVTLRVTDNNSATDTDTVLVTVNPGVIACDGIDFNQNGIFPEDQDVVDFFNVLAGGTCPYNDPCDIDFNNNGVFPEDQDVVDFFNVLAGGECP